MGALLSIFMIPFLWLAGFLAPLAPAGLQANYPEDFQKPAFVMPPKDSPYYEDLPWVTPWQWTKLPKVDWGLVIEEFKASPPEYQDFNRFFQLFGEQAGAEDFQIVISTWPRIAMVYHADTETATGISGEGVFHLGFDYSIRDFFYGTKNPWMRVLGYTPFYDWLASALRMFEIETVRVDFPYDGLDYRIQLWKGKYFFGTTSGCEIGIYTKPPSRKTEWYDCYPLEKMMPMAIKLYTEDEVYFDLEPEDHWWAVMLRARPPRVSPGAFTLECAIDFTKDLGLGDAFFEALQTQYPGIWAAQEAPVVSLRWDAD